MKTRRRLTPLTAQTTTPTLDSILTVVRTHHPDADVALLEHAHDEAAFWHQGQKRHSGDPFITHCLTVAGIVAELRMPPPVVCAALLHDVEDTACPPHRLTEQFGQDIADLVAAVRTLVLSARPPAREDAGHQPSAATPPREMAVLAIRLADRLHNMRTLAFVAQSRQPLIARETLDVFAPVARSAGLESVGRELQDLASAVLQCAPSSFPVARRFLTALTLLLPAPQRARWQEEWSAELAAHTTHRARARFTLRVLLSGPRLSMTLRRPHGGEQQW